MKNTRILGTLMLLLVSILFSTAAMAQQDKSKRPSPPATATGKIGNANVKIDYSSPSVKGRNVWTELAPAGKVWRSGANEATIFEVDQAVTVEGQTLPAGRYSLYTIPGEKEWTVIFNKTAEQWGTQYDEATDALRVTAKPKKAATMNERLAYDVTDKGFVLRWENLELPVMVKAQK